MFLSKASVYSCFMIHYIVKKDIFLVIVYMLHYKGNFKAYIKDCFKINDKQHIIMPKKGEYVKFKICERRIKLPFMIYAVFESILVPEDNEKQRVLY